MVVPSDLKYYPDSGRFLKFKPKKEKPPYLEVEEKTSFKKYLATYSIATTNLPSNVLNLLSKLFMVE